MVSVVFYIAALCSIAGAIGVVVSPNPIHSAMFLVMTLMSFAVHYVLLGADLAAAVQVIVYASAIVILFLFVIMLLGVDDHETLDEPLIGQRVIASFVSILFALTLLFVGGIKWASILLVGAVIGAVVLARRSTSSDDDLLDLASADNTSFVVGGSDLASEARRGTGPKDVEEVK